MADDQSLLQWLADFSQSVDLDAAPEPVRREAVLCFLDTVGCIIAGARTEEARVLIRAEMEIHGDVGQWAPEVTARVLGYLGDVLELNDLIGGHSSIGIVPALLAVGSRRAVTGHQVLRALLAGTEVTARLYDSSVGHFKPYSEGGTVIVSYFNAVGAAAALSLVHEFDRPLTVQAMAMSASLNSWCPAEVIFGQGGTIKPMLFGGNPASSAVLAATYAANGLTGPVNLLESPIGLFRSLATTYHPERIHDSERWFTATPQRKLHAACGYTHSSVDAVHQLSLDNDDIADIIGIEVAVPEFFREAVGKIGAPESPNDARFHLGYVVALAAQGLYPIIPEHTLRLEEYLAHGRTLELAELVRIVPDEAVGVGTSKPYNVSRVTVRFRDGSDKVATCHSPRGSAESPLTDEEVVEKFRSLVTPSAGEKATESLIREILDLGKAPDVSSLAASVWKIVAGELEATN